MAFRHYTRCTPAENWVGLPTHLGVGAAFGITVALGVLLAGGAVVPAIGVAALMVVIAYCRWWLYGRLICLGGDKCAVGMVLNVEPPDKKSGLDMFDTDYSFHLVLAPFRVGDDQSKVEQNDVQGYLIRPQPSVTAAGLPTPGFKPEDSRLFANDPPTAVLHCEFEGGGVYDVLLAALAALAFAAAATIVCSIPVLGWVACLVLGLIAAAIVLGGAAAALADRGDPNNVNPDLGELHTNDATGRGADLLVVVGTWVYDTAHEGWNEFHPIKKCQRIGQWTGSWDVDVKVLRDTWCEALAAAATPATVAAQSLPENGWEIHPLVDGCAPAEGRRPPIH